MIETNRVRREIKVHQMGYNWFSRDQETWKKYPQARKRKHSVYSKHSSRAGVGFLVHKEIANNVIEYRSSSERVAMVVLQLKSMYRVKIVQVYAPTSTYDDEVIEDMYEEINKLFDSVPTKYTMVLGDLNAKIGMRKKGESAIMGKYGIGIRNERGDRLIEFAASRQL